MSANPQKGGYVAPSDVVSILNPISSHPNPVQQATTPCHQTHQSTANQPKPKKPEHPAIARPLHIPQRTPEAPVASLHVVCNPIPHLLIHKPSQKRLHTRRYEKETDDGNCRTYGGQVMRAAAQGFGITLGADAANGLVGEVKQWWR